MQETQTKEFDFPVRLVDLVGMVGEGSGVEVPHKKGVFREDTEEIISVVGDQYHLVPHGEAVDFFEGVLDSSGIKFERGEAKVLQRGCTLYLPYLLPEERDVFKYSKKRRKKGDLVRLGFDLRNGLDGGTKLRMSINAQRLVCTNGLTVPTYVEGAWMVHRGNLSIEERLGSKIENLIQMYDSDILPVWGQFIDKSVTEEDAIKFVATLNTANKDKLAIYDDFKTYPVKERSMWALYNAVTTRTTHEISDRNYGTALTVSNQAHKLLARALSGKFPIYNDGVTISYFPKDDPRNN